jgi:type II secretory pathway component PulF
MRAAETRRLHALADLLDAGHSPVEALTALERLGGAVAQWARPLIMGVRNGVPLGMVLAQAGVLSSPELIWVGGAEHAGRASSLRVVATQRIARQTRRRAVWAAMLMPAVMAVFCSSAGRFVLGLLGSKSGGLLGDLLPLALIALGVALGLMDRQRRLVKYRDLPVLSRWLRPHHQARIAEALGAGLARPEGEAAALEAASRLADAPALQRIANRLREGASFAENLPRADEVGEPLALCIAAGHASGDLPQRLAAYSEQVDDRLTDHLARFVRVLAWLVVLWVNLRTLWSFADVSFLSGGGGGGGMPMLPGVDSKDLQDLMRELDM